MSENKPSPPTTTEVVSKTLAQRSLIGVQAGCVSVIVVIGALVVGMLLDRVIGTQYIFTVGLLLLSIPASLAAMVYSVLRSTQSMRTQSSTQATQKEDSLEKTH
jgi:F0F1-type ATP synthase assembly protein I